MNGDDSDVIGITQRELLIEMRDDILALRSVVDSVARDQALSVERRASMRRVADTITARRDSHEKAILDLQRSPVVARPAPIRTSVRSPLCQEEEEGARNHEHRDSGDKDPVAPPEVAVDPADQDEDRGHHREQGQEWMRPHTRRHLIPPPIAAAR